MSFLHKQTKALSLTEVPFFSQVLLKAWSLLESIRNPSLREEPDIVNEAWLRSPLVPANILQIPEAFYVVPIYLSC